MTNFSRSTRQRVGDDGRTREYLVTIPENPRAVVLGFHPYGFDPEAVVDGEDVGLRLERPLAGVAAPAAQLGLALIAPRGQGKVQPAAGTLGYPEHVDSAVAAAQELAGELGGLPIVTTGLSLGGQETLLAAGRHPEVISAVCAVNPIADLAAWYRDLFDVPVQIMLDFGVPAQVEEEVGGLPDTTPEKYTERSAVGYLDALASLPVKIVWSPQDNLVPLGGTHQGGRLAQELRSRGAQVSESIVTHQPTEGQEPGRYAHESMDVWSALGFLVEHVRTESTANVQ